MHNKMLHICRVCGYCDEELFPWGEDGETPTFEICPCCNVEFGYEDAQISSIIRYRKKWRKSSKFKTDSKYLRQLQNIQAQYF